MKCPGNARGVHFVDIIMFFPKTQRFVVVILCFENLCGLFVEGGIFFSTFQSTFSYFFASTPLLNKSDRVCGLFVEDGQSSRARALHQSCPITKTATEC